MKNDHLPQDIGPYQLISSEIKYQNPWITVREDAVIRPDNTNGIFGIVEMIPGSSVVALDDQHNIFLVQEFKYGIQQDTLELVSGGLDKNESPLEGAKRELREEAGITAEEWTDLGMINPFTTVVNSPNYLFLAQTLTRQDSNPAEGENIKIIKMSFDNALDLVLTGKITHAASCVGILKTARILGNRT